MMTPERMAAMEGTILVSLFKVRHTQVSKSVWLLIPLPRVC
jgi:hypothetical protein